ncbi:MAG: DUF1553 domain-containing protein [Pirellula sp.]
MLITIGLSLECFTALVRADEGSDLYTRNVLPVLKEKCFACHGPVRQEAGLRLDTAAFIKQGSDDGTVVTASSPDASKLLIRVSATAANERMPPTGEGVPLKSEQIARIREWIAQGMPAPNDEPTIAGPSDHWAFQPISRKPISESSIGTAQKIDELIDAAQSRLGMVALPTADPLTLLRRVTFDLTGLPPTDSEQTEFAADHSADAYSSYVLKLLDRPTYGERWARHWMDIWRYSDWDGYKEELRGSQRNIWHWRDWIIESLNRNKPYDGMITEMLAADEMDPLNQDTLRATGFLARNYHRSNRNIWLDATVEHTAKAFLGLTINCSKCHDHKYDPISQVDYYRFRAVFEPHHVRTDPVFVSSKSNELVFPRAYDKELAAVTNLFLRGDEKYPDKERPISPGVPSALPISSPYRLESIPIPLASSFPELQPEAEQFAIKDAWKKIDDVRASLDRALASNKDKVLDGADRPVVKALKTDLEVEILKLQEAVASLASIQARFAADKAKHLQNDSVLSDALAPHALSKEQAWREIEAELKVETAKRTLRTAEDSHNKDSSKKNAAVEKVKKELTAVQESQRKLMASDGSGKLKAYTPVTTGHPRESTGRRTALARWIVDKQNPLTARVAVNHIWARHFGSPLVENVFDFGMKTPQPELVEVLDILAADLIDSGWDMKRLHRSIVCSKAYRRASSGNVDQMAGPKRIDPDNRYYWRANVRRLEAEEVRDSVLVAGGLLDRSSGGPDIDEEQGEKVMRRSIYFRHAYEKQMTMMVMFDAASPAECYQRRPSIIPQQALVLANSALARTASRNLGSQAFNEPDQRSQARIETLFARTLSRPPTQQETAECEQFLNEHGVSEQTLQSLAHVLINHNDFVSVR